MSPTQFSVQINELFYEFDKAYHELQSFCDSAKHVTYEHLINVTNVNNLALAAKFDNVWYRAKICTQNKELYKHLSESASILIELIDYGNTQLTAIEDCVYLNESLSNYNQCAFKCAGLSYFKAIMHAENSKIDAKTLGNLLYYAKATLKDGEDVEKHDWTSASFFKVNKEIHLEIDELFKLIFSLVLVEASFYLDPNEYNERILKQSIQHEMNPTNLVFQDSFEFQVTASNLDEGFLYMYFNTTSSLNEMIALEKELESESIELLTCIPNERLVSSRFYLVKYKEKFYRAMLLAQTSNKGCSYFVLIDLGKKLAFNVNEANMNVFPLMPKYFKYNSMAFHCRLVLGYNFEKLMTNEEKLKFFEETLARNTLKIKLMSFNEPYLIKIVKDTNMVFDFAPIIARIKLDNCAKWKMEPQTILNGNNASTLDEEFFFGGDLLKGNEPNDLKRLLRSILSKSLYRLKGEKMCFKNDF